MPKVMRVTTRQRIADVGPASPRGIAASPSVRTRIADVLSEHELNQVTRR